MAIALASKPGLSSTTTLHIPKTWDPTWFRNLISNQLKGADVRNAISGPGISITGNISSPYATISIGGSGPVTLPGPVTVTSGGTPVFEVTGNLTGVTVEAYGPTAGTLVDLTPDTGTFPVTATGMTTSPTGTATWTRIGKLVMLCLPVVTGTSNANTFTFTGLPAEIRPATLTQQIAAPTDTFEDSSALLTFNASILVTAGSGTISFLKNGSTTTWTPTGTKGLDAVITFGYLLN